MLVSTENRIYLVIQIVLGVGIKSVFQFSHHSVDHFFVSVALHGLQAYFII